MDSSEQVRSCPFCGEDPKVTVWSACELSPNLDDLAKISCDNDDCYIKPSTRFEPMDVAIMKWNRRANTENAVEMVFCKDCKHYSAEYENYCWFHDENKSDVDFCSEGMRKDGE